MIFPSFILAATSAGFEIAPCVCIQMSASDAYMRDFTLFAPKDAVAAQSRARRAAALQWMSTEIAVDTRSSTSLDLKAMNRRRR